MTWTTSRLNFRGHSGAKLSARLDLPVGAVTAYALFAHCFTCTKDLPAARNIAIELARVGIAALRFDFTGLGSSEGEFSATNFSTNVADLVAAADYLRSNYKAPSVLIGHSLGGAAVLAVTSAIPEVQAVVTIGAPAHADHVLKNFTSNLEDIETTGKAEVRLAGRPFTIERQFVNDIRNQRLINLVEAIRKPLLVLHSPTDATVGIENASEIFRAAKHPKSFVSLDTADHLLTKQADSKFAARVIAGWLTRYIDAAAPQL